MYSHAVPTLLGSSEYRRRGEGDAAEMVRREAAILHRARHPGIVPAHHLSEQDGVVTLLRHLPEGASLDRVELTLAETCGVFAVLATTVADLHHLDVATGALDGSDVILDRGGRPVIVSLARAAYPAGSARVDDVKALGALLETAIRLSVDVDETPGAGRRWGWRRQPNLRQALARVAASAAEGRLTAQQLATALARPEATLPSEAARDPEVDRAPERDARSSPRALGLAVTVVCAAAGLLLVITALRPPSRPRLTIATPAARSPHLCVTVGPAGDCRTTATFVDGVLRSDAGTFAVGRPGDIVATGRWGCRPQPTLALLRPDRGEIWVFDSWPADSLPLTARLAGRVAGATGLGVEANGSCDRIVVTRADGSRVPILVGAQP